MDSEKISSVESPRTKKFPSEICILVMDDDSAILPRHNYEGGLIESGATLYLVKHVSENDIENLLQYVSTRKKNKTVGEGCSAQRASRPKNVTEADFERTSAVGEAKETSATREEVDDSTTQKKQRVVWTDEMHEKFLEAIEQLGLERAIPNKILKHMNVAGLTRHNVASHLQHHRRYLKRVQEGKKSTDNINKPCFQSGHSPLNFSLLQVNSQLHEQPTPLQVGLNGNLSMPSFYPASSLNPELSTSTTSISNLGHGQSLPMSTQGNKQLPFLSHATSLSASTSQNNINSFGTESAQMGLQTQFPGGNENDNILSSINRPYVGFRMKNNGELVGFGQVGLSNSNEIGRNMAISTAQNSGDGNLNQYPLTFINTIPQQQPSLPPQQEPNNFAKDEIDILLSELESTLSPILQDGDFDDILIVNQAIESFMQQEGGEAAMGQVFDRLQ